MQYIRTMYKVILKDFPEGNKEFKDYHIALTYAEEVGFVAQLYWKDGCIDIFDPLDGWYSDHTEPTEDMYYGE